MPLVQVNSFYISSPIPCFIINNVVDQFTFRIKNGKIYNCFFISYFINNIFCFISKEISGTML